MITTVFVAALIALLSELTYQLQVPVPSNSLHHQESLVNVQNLLRHDENLSVTERAGVNGNNPGSYIEVSKSLYAWMKWMCTI